MRRRVKKIMAFLLAFALVMSAAGSGKLTVLAETSAQETAVETQSQSAVQNTEPQGGSGSSGQPEQPLEEEVQTGNTGTENENNGNVSSEQNGQTASVPESSSSVEPSSSESGMTGSSETGATESSSGSESTSESESTTESASESESTTESASETESVTQTEENSEEETTETATETEEETTETETETLTEEEGDGAEAMEYTPESQPEGIHVWAYAKEGTFPEGTKMLVSRLDGSAKEEAGAKLDENGVEYDGFFALDISFEGPDGNKIEPEEGSVEVRFEVDASFLPEEADTDSLEVQHLDESGNSTNVETVATAAEGSVSVNSDKVKAAFAVESFSTFTITYTVGSGSNEKDLASLTVHCVDEKGNPINGDMTMEKEKIALDTSYSVDTLAKEIHGYQFLRAVAVPENGTLETGIEFTKLKLQRELDLWNWEYTYTWQYQSGRSWTDIDNLYFVYREDAPVYKTETVTAKVFLRYDNQIPNPINVPIENSEYGPSGNAIGYMTVEVDLSEIEVPVSGYDNKFYYSAENETDIANIGSDRLKELAQSYWNEYIRPAINEDDLAALDEMFGGHFIGYVLKGEGNDGKYWHIDGVLDLTPPIYQVELYEKVNGTVSSNPSFTIASNNQSVPGVSYQDFKNELEKELGGTNYNYITQEYDKIVVSYEKDGYRYETTVTPYTSASHGADYHVYPDKGKFGYHQATNGRFYYCYMVMETVEKGEISGNITISKTVISPLGTEVTSDFEFILNAQGLSENFSAIKSLQDGTEKEEKVSFMNGSASIWLKDGESISISGLPKGQLIYITEKSGNYTTTNDHPLSNGEDGSKAVLTVSGDPQTVSFTNTMNVPVPTGIHTGQNPWLGMIGAAITGLGGYLVFFRKRKRAG